jgi:5-methylcytosine-specific restriction endonuclease McrA
MNKTCFICESALPATPEYFNRDASRNDGLHPYCKECRSKRRAERYANSPEKQAKAQARMAQWVKDNPKRHKANGRRNYLENREYYIEKARQWREDNPEQYLANSREYYYANKDRFADSKKQYREEHKDEIDARRNQWAKDNPEKVKRIKRNYRTRKAGNGGAHTAEEIQERIEEQGYMCFYCSHPLEGDYHVDHFVPVSRGGGSEIENLVASCPSCNLSKGDKDPHEFMSQIGRAFVYN